MVKESLHRAMRRVGFDLVRFADSGNRQLPKDADEQDAKIIEQARPYTMTSNERLMSLIAAVRHVALNKIEGAIAECGVWNGGSMMTAAMTLVGEGDTSRDLFLYDTFEGMSTPTEADRSYDGVAASDQLAETPEGEGVWCYSSLDEVKANLGSIPYPQTRIHYIKGKIEETIPENSPRSLAVLRLDTDWYESTRHELRYLFPLLVDGGILIIDDYGHWQGARKAVDEFLAASSKKYFLHRIDDTGRLIVK